MAKSIKRITEVVYEEIEKLKTGTDLLIDEIYQRQRRENKCRDILKQIYAGLSDLKKNNELGVAETGWHSEIEKLFNELKIKL